MGETDIRYSSMEIPPSHSVPIGWRKTGAIFIPDFITFFSLENSVTDYQGNTYFATPFWVSRAKKINFASSCMYAKNPIDMSVDKVLDIAKTITTLKIKLPVSNKMMTKTMLLTKKHLSIAPLYDEKFRENL